MLASMLTLLPPDASALAFRSREWMMRLMRSRSSV